MFGFGLCKITIWSNMEHAMEEILKKAEETAQSQSYDAAARSLAPWRKAACEAIKDDISKLGDLLAIVSTQMHYLNKSGAPDKAASVAEWFLHAFHHIEEDMPGDESRLLKRTFAESFASFFMRYATALRDLERFDDMQAAVRTSLDMTRFLPASVTAMLNVYAPMHKRETIGDESASEYLLKRYAEMLAMLDFAGLHNHAVRAALDEYQYALRGHVDEARTSLESICQNAPDDVLAATIWNLFSLNFPYKSN